MADGLFSHVKWLNGIVKAADDAIDDMRYNDKTGKPIYVAFDQSTIFAPISRKDKLNINNPRDWLDIYSEIIFQSLDYLTPIELGYQLVLPYTTYLAICLNYKIDDEFVSSLHISKDKEQLYFLISSRMNSNKPLSEEEIVTNLSSFIIQTQ